MSARLKTRTSSMRPAKYSPPDRISADAQRPAGRADIARLRQRLHLRAVHVEAERRTVVCRRNVRPGIQREPCRTSSPTLLDIAGSDERRWRNRIPASVQRVRQIVRRLLHQDRAPSRLRSRIDPRGEGHRVGEIERVGVIDVDEVVSRHRTTVRCRTCRGRYPCGAGNRAGVVLARAIRCGCPAASLKPYAATRPAGAGDAAFSTTTLMASDCCVLFDVSRATAVKHMHAVWNGRRIPDERVRRRRVLCTKRIAIEPELQRPATAMLSVAVAVSVTFELIVSPSRGAVITATGLVVSENRRRERHCRCIGAGDLRVIGARHVAVQSMRASSSHLRSEAGRWSLPPSCLRPSPGECRRDALL